MRVAALDLGSTSFHLVVVDVSSDGRMKRVLRRREVLHLGAIVARDGHLGGEEARMAVRATRILRRAADETSPHVVVAAATHALREAANGEDLLGKLEVASRCPIRLLDGSEEARLVYDGVRSTIGIGNEPTLVCDLGGGSLELAVGRGDEVIWDASFPLGASRLWAQFVRNDPPSADECERVVSLTCRTIRAARAELAREFPFLRCVGTGGTLRALARIELATNDIARDVNGFDLPSARLNSLCAQLLRLPRHERLALPGMASRRADAIGIGALVLATLTEELDLPGVTVSDGGLREGMILEAVAQAKRRVRAAS